MLLFRSGVHRIRAITLQRFATELLRGDFHITSRAESLICASAKQKQQIIKMQRLWNAFQVSAVELERARVQKNSANEIIEYV